MFPPTPSNDVPMPYFANCCGVTCGMNARNTDCFYYNEFQDMGAHIPACTYGHECRLDNFSCSGCSHYITKTQARELVDKAVRER